MRITEIIEEKVFYHGSSAKLPVGTILTSGHDNYERNWADNNWYQALEKYRPPEYRPHSWSVFMVDNDNDLDNAGGGTEWVFTVEPIGQVSRHDLNWSSEISVLFDKGYDMFSDTIEEAALNYWNGVPHYNESVWEYLVPKARIISVEKF